MERVHTGYSEKFKGKNAYIFWSESPIKTISEKSTFFNHQRVYENKDFSW